MYVTDMTDKQLVRRALQMWSNYIQTGDVTISQSDAKNMNRKVKPLTIEQMEFIVRLDKIKNKIEST